jgi:hypothetical protein
MDENVTPLKVYIQRKISPDIDACTQPNWEADCLRENLNVPNGFIDSLLDKGSGKNSD